MSCAIPRGRLSFGGCLTTPINERVGCAALECGSSLPLLLQPACWLQDRAAMGLPASKLAGRKAAASCRTPKLRLHARWKQSDFPPSVGLSHSLLWYDGVAVIRAWTIQTEVSARIIALPRSATSAPSASRVPHRPGPPSAERLRAQSKLLTQLAPMRSFLGE